MILQEPKVEFVPIDLNQSVIATSACNGFTSSGGVQICSGTQEDAIDCPNCVGNYQDWTTGEVC